MPNPQEFALDTPRPAVEPLEPRRLAAATHRLLRIGSLGDSYSDEYRFYPPDRSHARNWVEQLSANHRATFGTFTTHSRGAPRNQGYANDWAESGATTADLPSQAAGLAAQAAAGEVDVATVLVGGNDVLDLLAADALDPSASPAAFGPLADVIVARIEAAVGTILAASPTVKVVVATLPPVSRLPVVMAAGAVVDGAALVAAADAAEATVNAAVTAFAAADRRLAVADFAAAATAFDGPTYAVGRVKVDAVTPGDGPRHLFLADGIHPGTVGQGLLANTFVGAIDAAFGQSIKPLTAGQILADAGLGSR